MYYMEHSTLENQNPFAVLEHFHFQISVAEQASDSDTELTKLYLEGVTEENLDKIYRFVHSVEIGCGFDVDPQLNKFFSDAYNQDAKKALKTIDSRALSVVEAICLLYCMSVEQIVFYIDELNPQNSVFLFESIRHLLKNVQYVHQYTTVIAKGVTQLAKIDNKRFIFLLKKHEYSANWFIVLPAALEKLSDEALLIFSETIDLSHRFEDQKMIQDALVKLDADRESHVFSVISENIISRWHQLCEEHRQEYKFHTSMFITGYIPLILGALITHYDPEQRNHLLVQALQTLYLDLHMWYKNASQLQSIFFLNITKVYFLLLTLENQKIDPQIFPLLDKLKHTMQRFNHAWKHGNYEEKECLEQYIDALCNSDHIPQTKTYY